jgi:hypothetical protein
MAINLDDAREVLQRAYDINNEEAPQVLAIIAI